MLFPLMMEAARTSETSVDNNFTRQYIPEDRSERKQLFLVICILILWCNAEVLTAYWMPLMLVKMQQTCRIFIIIVITYKP
jgi:hypothetical protein